MSLTAARGLMISALLVRSTSFLFSKFCLAEMGPFELLGLRFLFACVFLLPLVWWHRARVSATLVKNSAILGFLLFLVMTCEMMALQRTDIYMVAFLENSVFVLVPVYAYVLHREKISGRTARGMGIILLGVAALTLKGGSIQLTPGILWALAITVFYALFILATGEFAHKEDPLVLGILQMGWMGLFSLAAAFTLGSGVSLSYSGTAWWYLFILTFLCGCFGFTFQTVAQKYLAPSDAGFLCALDPLFATLWAMLFAGENPGLTGAAGALLIVGGLGYMNGRKHG